MKRRNFLKSAVTTTSACALAGSITLAGANDEKKETVTKCKLTVVKKEFYPEFFEEFRGRKGKVCPLFEVGQEIILNNPWKCPDDFCDWAWADLRPFIQQVFNGKEKNVACCTDGARPVIFKLERIEVAKA